MFVLYYCTILCYLTATVTATSEREPSGIRITFNSSVVWRLQLYHSAKFGKSFDDASSVHTTLLDAAFFKGFCKTLAPVSTSFKLKNAERLIPPKNLSVKRQQDDKESRVPFNYYGGNIPIFVECCNESFISFHISAWGAKRNMSCGVLLINFATRESYRDFLSGELEEYDHLESKCIQVGTNTPLLSSVTFYLNKTGYYQQAAKIVDGNITVDANVSGSLFYNHHIPTTKNITETEYCKYAKQSLCSHGLAGQSAVLRYFSSQPMEINNSSVCHAMYDNKTLIEFGVVAFPRMYNDYFHPEIIVLKSQTDSQDHDNIIIKIIEHMSDHRFVSSIFKYKIPIISFIIFFVLKQATVYFISIILNYCFRLYLYLFLLVYVSIFAYPYFFSQMFHLMNFHLM